MSNFFSGTARSLCGAGLVKRASAFATSAAQAHYTPSTKAHGTGTHGKGTHSRYTQREHRRRQRAQCKHAQRQHKARCLLLLQDLCESCARGGSEEKGRVLWDATSRGLCVRVGPPRTVRVVFGLWRVAWEKCESTGRRTRAPVMSTNVDQERSFV